MDILIINAGHGLQGPCLDAPLDAAMAMVRLDIASQTAMTRLFGQDLAGGVDPFGVPSPIECQSQERSPIQGARNRRRRTPACLYLPDTRHFWNRE